MTKTSPFGGHTFTAANQEGGSAFAVAGPVSSIAFMPGQEKSGEVAQQSLIIRHHGILLLWRLILGKIKPVSSA